MLFKYQISMGISYYWFIYMNYTIKTNSTESSILRDWYKNYYITSSPSSKNIGLSITNGNYLKILLMILLMILTLKNINVNFFFLFLFVSNVSKRLIINLINFFYLL